MASSSGNKAFRSGTKKILHNIIKFCDQEAENGEIIVPLNHPTKRASEIAGVSLSTIKRIRREAGDELNPDFDSPKKRVKKDVFAITAIDEFDCSVIRRTVHDFYVKEKKIPSLNKLLPVLKESINFNWNKEILRQILHKIGFKWKSCQNKRKVLLEREDIILKRINFLRNIKKYRTEDRPIIYIDETWVDSNLTFNKCWQSGEVDGVLQTGNASRRIIVLCAGGYMGFLPNTNLIYKANSTQGDYHGQMNSNIFEKWAREKLIPNLPKDSVIVIDNAPYHTVQVEKIPNSSSRKSEILDWLAAKSITHSPDALKVELLELVKLNAPPFKTYKFDELLKGHGFNVLRLPPYHCDFNAIEYVWSDIKRQIRNINPTGDLSMSKLLREAEEAINEISSNRWQSHCNHVHKLELMYWRKDAIIEEMCESVQISLTNTEESDSEYDSEATVSADSEATVSADEESNI